MRNINTAHIKEADIVFQISLSVCDSAVTSIYFFFASLTFFYQIS